MGEPPTDTVPVAEWEAARRATGGPAVADVVSAAGNHLAMIVKSLDVFSTTGSTVRTDLVVVFQMIPFIVGGGSSTAPARRGSAS